MKRFTSSRVVAMAVATLFFVCSPESLAVDMNTILDADLIKTSGLPEFGRFYGWRTPQEGPAAAFSQAYSLAVEQNIPLVVVFSAEGCSHCAGFADNMNKGKEALLDWMSRRRVIFTYFKGSNTESPPEAAAAYNFIVDRCGLAAEYSIWPFYAIYYQPENGSPQVDVGSFGLDRFSTGSYMAWDVGMFTNRCDVMFRAWVPGGAVVEPEQTATPGDADFACGMTETAQLEALPSTRTVYVPLAKYLNLSSCTTNLLEVTFPDLTTFSTSVVWSANADVERLTQDVPVQVAGHGVTGQPIGLKLYDAQGKLNATNRIVCVEEAATSHHYPLWIGEKAASGANALDFGEWTFDFDTATNKVRLAAAGGTDAYTLVVVGGGLWCPDCISCEKYLTEDSRFVAWARANNIALVVSDQPQMGTTASSMVTHDIGRRGTSGSYYLSRKGLTTAEGLAQFAVMTNRSYNLWKLNPAATRVANPTFILFRPDGTIAGRLTESRIKENGVGTNSEKYNFNENMLRFAELLRLAADRTEEWNNTPSQNLPEYEFGATNTCQLQVCDTADVFRFTGIREGETFRVHAVNPAGAKSVSAVRLLTVTNAANGAFAELPSLVDNLWRLTQAQVDAGVYLEVSSFADARYAVYGGNTELTATFYTEVVPGDPGVVGFASSAVTVSEGDGGVMLELERTRGSKGEVSVQVELDAGGTSATAGTYKWNADDVTGHTLSWNDYEFGKKGLWVPIVNDNDWTGSRTLAFTVRSADNAGIEIVTSNVVVTVEEDEILAPGRLEICSTTPAAVQGFVVNVPAASVVKLDVRRVNGTLDSVATGFEVSHSGVKAGVDRLEWQDGEKGVQTATFRLPAIEAFAGNPVFTITLVPEGDTAVTAAKRRVTVRVVDPDTAAFDDEISSLIETIQNCVFSQTFTLNDGRFNQNAKIVTRDGELPRGLSAEWDADAGELTVSGVIRDSGEHTVTLWLESETGETTLPASVTIAARPLSDCSELLTVPHDYRALPVVAETGTPGVTNVIGSLDVSIPLSGRLSARYRRIDGTTVPFVFDGWTGLDGGGNVYAETAGSAGFCCGMAAPLLRIATADDGTFDIRLTDQEYGTVSLTAQKCEPWSYADPAAGWCGVYTIGCVPTNSVAPAVEALCKGAATFTCRMTSGAAASGRMTYAGILPNGYPVSGSVCLFRAGRDFAGDEPAAVLSLFHATSSDSFGAILRILTDGALRRAVVRQDPSAIPCWRHTEQDFPSLSYVQPFDAYGSWYNSQEDWPSMLWPLYLFAETYTDVVSVKLATTLLTDLLVDSTAPNPAGITLEVNYATGQIRGSFRATDSKNNERTASYQGALVPGWGNGCNSCGGSSQPVEVVDEHPLAVGAWWWQDNVPYDDNGVTREKCVKTGGAVSIDKSANN